FEAWLESEAVPPDRRDADRAVDLRYQGQNFEVRVKLPDAAATLDAVLDSFAQEHARTYGYAIPGRTVELVNCRLTALGRMPRGAPEPPPAGGAVEAARIGLRDCYFDAEIGWRSTPVYDRDLLPAGARLAGPAIIEEMSATTVAFPGQTVELDHDGNIVLRQPARTARRQEVTAHA
ncbi:MAG: hypothetical protein B7Z53_01340, partial [Rhodospirillales bacterium 12-71-4]